MWRYVKGIAIKRNEREGERERDFYVNGVKPVYLTSGTRRQYVPTISDVCLTNVLLCWKPSVFWFFFPTC